MPVKSRDVRKDMSGNEKLKQPICAAPWCRIQYQRDLPTIVECCTNYPVQGGKHQEGSRYIVC